MTQPQSGPHSPQGPLALIRALLSNSAAKSIVGTLVLKAVSAILVFSLFTVAANAAGAEEFGKYSILFSIASLLSIVAVMGQELKVVRGWNQYLAQKQPALALGVLRYGWILSLMGSFVVSLAFAAFLLSDWAALSLQINGDEMLVLATIAFLVTNTLSLFSTHAARAIISIRVGDGYREPVWRTLVIFAIVASLLYGHAITTTEIFAFSALGLMLSIVIQSFLINRKIAKELGSTQPLYDVKSWMPRSLRMWFATMMEATNQHIEVLLIGILLDPLAAGGYFVAARLANAFAMVADGINTFGTRRIPGLYFEGNQKELSQNLRVMVLMTLISIASGLGIVLLFGHLLLSLFGAIYMDYYLVLVILSIGTAATALAGPAPSFLMITGHEAGYVRTVTFSVLCRVVGFLLIVPSFGILGAAIVTASILAIMSFYLNGQCRSKTGIDFSIFRLVRKQKDALPAHLRSTKSKNVTPASSLCSTPAE